MKHALVTGSSGSLGAAIARRLAQAGHYVIIHAHLRIDVAKTLAADIVRRGGSAELVHFDIVDLSETNAAFARLPANGPIQILVNNADFHDDAVLPGMTHDQWSRVLDVSLNGFLNVTQPLLLPMIRTRWGRIGSIASVSAILGIAVRSITQRPRPVYMARRVRWRSNWPAGASLSTRSHPASSNRR